MATLWDKGHEADLTVERFTVGRDRELDMRLAPFDVRGSIAHVRMLAAIGLLTEDEGAMLVGELEKILVEIENGAFTIEDGVEDIHSQIEILLTERIGDLGAKIHSGRSRNDQVLTDLMLYFKHEIGRIRDGAAELFTLLQSLSEQHRDTLMPGFTHTQIAMPSSFGLWFGAYAESLVSDMYMLAAAFRTADQNPLGSAAGYGNSFPLDRAMTTSLLGFGTMSFNSVAAQMNRGKCEKALAGAMASFAATLNKLSDDCILFSNGNYGFVSFPDSLTTGSSIMPHKKNPDVWELLRARCNRLLAVPNEIALLTTNMTHGYHRDFQLLKEIVFPAIDTMHEVLGMSVYALQHITVNRGILDHPAYDTLFTVEEVNRLVLAGTPFRKAYREVAGKVARGSYRAVREVNHTHAGSIGNLCTEEIRRKFEATLSMFV